MATVEVDRLGDTVELQVGDEVLVRLPENPSTGYRWELDASRGGLELAEDTYVGPRGSTVGGAGERHFRLRATGEGAAQVQLRLARSWEDGAAEQGSVAVSVQRKQDPAPAADEERRPS